MQKSIPAIIVSALIFWGAHAFADDPAKIETAFVYQFTNYIQWPEEPAQETFIISVMGSPSLVHELELLAQNKTAKGRKIVIQQINETAQLKTSNIVILGSSNEKHLEEIRSKTKKGGTLIITFSDGFAKKGAMINFYLDEGRIRFEINRAALENAKLQASSQLLKLAKLID